VDLAGAADLGEVRVLRQEAVAGVDRLDVGDLGRRDDRGDAQVRLAARRGPDADGLVGLPQVERVRVRLRVHGDGLDAELAAGADDALGDLAAVGDQDPPEHQAVFFTPSS
jgi:hypothetical protein